MVQSRLVVHQMDPRVEVPGGIDACLRGLFKYSSSQEYSLIGVDAVGDLELGRWYEYSMGDKHLQWMPVAKLGPADKRRIPHSVRIVVGVLLHLKSIQKFDWLQTHRADIAFLMSKILKRKFSGHHYFIHSQKGGIASQNSDSYWKHISIAHLAIEKSVIRHSSKVAVFNLEYGAELQKGFSQVSPFPTWYDSDIFYTEPTTRDQLVMWVGRLEEPKNPLLGLETFKKFIAAHVGQGWRLIMAGEGSLRPDLEMWVTTNGMSEYVEITGPLPRSEVANKLRQAKIFLMTSHAGYEGFPRILIEALACGASAVVTDGADTGAIVDSKTNGIRATANVDALVMGMSQAVNMKSEACAHSVATLTARNIVKTVLGESVDS